MAKGRMLNKKISNSKRVNDLPSEAALLYTWLIPHLDYRGVFYGSAQMVKSLVFPRRNAPVKQVENWLRSMEAAKNDNGIALIKRFRIDGDLFLWMPGFKGEQPGLRAERESTDFPEPPQCADVKLNSPENAGILPEYCQPDAGNLQENSRENPAEEELENKVNRKINEKAETQDEPLSETAEKGVVSDAALELSNCLKTLILRNNPKARMPEKVTGWAEDIERMLRIDRLARGDIEAVINFSQRDPFWCSNILSGRSLREKYNQLYLKMTKGGSHHGVDQENYRGYPQAKHDLTTWER